MSTAMASGSGSSSASASASSSAPSSSGGATASATTMNAHILVDQFGYRPGDAKVAVIRNPDMGFDTGDTFTPGTSYQLRQSSDGTVVFTGSPTPWNNGAVEASSGDNGWFFDFSSVTTPGAYFVYDTSSKVRSPTFNINQNVYKNVLMAAMRMYFYQRSGSTDGGGAKATPFADQCWADTPAYVGPNQDGAALKDMTPTDTSTAHDLSGGWFDAGDTNKYVTFASAAVHQLLSAYQENPAVFTDDFNIPESGNGVPDLIDEVKYETDWVKKMQIGTDGSVALKVGEMTVNLAAPPSSDTTARYYVDTCSSSTIAAAGIFAHAALVYKNIASLASEAADLQSRAVKAYTSYQNSVTAGTIGTNCDTGILQAGDADWTAGMQNQEAVVAAVYLYALTGDSSYNTFVMNNYTVTEPFNDIGFTRTLPEQGKALLYYTTLSNADATLKNTLLAAKLSDVNNSTTVYGYNDNDDLYRNLLDDDQYYEGSNYPRADYGNTNADVPGFNIGVSSTAAYNKRALETLHYFHGVNPFGMAYLSNMSQYGATSSVNELFHVWYAPNTQWADAVTSTCGPAPGYVVAGPISSDNAATAGLDPTMMPPSGQPEQKGYLDFNGFSNNSFVVSEPAIYFQAAYVELLARFAN